MILDFVRGFSYIICSSNDEHRYIDDDTWLLLADDAYITDPDWRRCMCRRMHRRMRRVRATVHGIDEVFSSVRVKR